MPRPKKSTKPKPAQPYGGPEAAKDEAPAETAGFAATTPPKSPARGTQGGAPVRKKKQFSPLDLAKAVSGDPGLLSYRFYDGDFLVVIMSTGQKHTFSPAHVQAIRTQLEK